ncbi:sensor histidine kinase [Algoriphagus machipongonensis]|uniref:histidine kinase n=1 Tax=Algoriphagus machipongonensis TaxID=388413 RepID=A3HZR4_9BACT|nr:7TM diverse intracellular signaling domain-containing protein [Algoriphagus machipongonensis]EAZ80750.2 phosphoglycerate transport protein for signal transmission [Algoriphagus machipongonensis]
MMYKIFVFCLLFLATTFQGFAQFENVEKVECFSYKMTDPDVGVEELIQEESFTYNNCNNFNFGINESVLWVKLELNGLSDIENPTFTLNSTSLDLVDFYSVKGGEVIREQKNGRLLGIEARDVDSQKIIFEINNEEITADYFLVRIQNVDKKIFTGFVSSKEDLLNILNFEEILFGILTGIFIGLFFYNLFLYFSVKDKIYFIYVLHTLLVWFAQASILGFTQFLLWPDWDWMNQRSIVIFSSLVSIVGIWFLRIFLLSKSIVPKLDKGFNVIFLVYGFILLNAIVFSITISYQVLLVTQSIVVIFVLAVAVMILRKGYRPARYYLLAWSIFMVGIFLFVFSEMGIIPSNNFTAYIMPLGSALEVVLLSFALADRINILKKEKEREQAERLEVLKENETLVKEQNTLLEKKVKMRTDELESALRNLQNTQSQLVNQEKMASLGQLTAGIAHEINNPINFVSSNIMPLKRDIKDIMEVIDFYRNTGLKEFTEESKKEAKDLEEDLELDYVLDEVDQLLKGMEDGARRTVEIVKGLRLFSRVDEQDVKKVDLHDGINSTIILLNSSIPGKIRIVREFNELPMVECLAGKINQVFMNIINNAVHALSDHMEEIKDPHITIRTKSKVDYVTVEIEDNGPGMPDTVKERIFEPFFTTKAVGKGTGLGLSIVYSIIENHKGTLEVKTTQGEGTTFIITLPVNQSTQKYE